MSTEVVLAGVGGQGVLSAAAIVAEAAHREGLTVKQGEVHGMSQRGGAVLATVRMSDRPIHADLVPRGTAALIIGMEPIEALRYVDYLRTDGVLVTSTEPQRNIPDYPPIDEVLDRVREVPGSILIEAKQLAREVRSPRSANVVMLGAAIPFLPFAEQTVESCIADFFAAKGERVVQGNLRALRAGRGAVAPTLS